MRAYMRRGRGRVAVNLHRLRLVQHLKLNLVPHKMADHRHFSRGAPSKVRRVLHWSLTNQGAQLLELPAHMSDE